MLRLDSRNLRRYTVFVKPRPLPSQLVIPVQHQTLIIDAHETMLLLCATEGVLRPHPPMIVLQTKLTYPGPIKVSTEGGDPPITDSSASWST
jgi:hypothetical protein